jgi:hypothetical protein
MLDSSYYRKRAVTERALALRSDRMNVREIHMELARLYEALVGQEDLRIVQVPPTKAVLKRGLHTNSVRSSAG